MFTCCSQAVSLQGQINGAGQEGNVAFEPFWLPSESFQAPKQPFRVHGRWVYSLSQSYSTIHTALHGVMQLSKVSICMFSRMQSMVFARTARCFVAVQKASTDIPALQQVQCSSNAFRSAVLQKATKFWKSFLQRTFFLSQQACFN